MRLCKILGGGECYGLFVCVFVAIAEDLIENQAC